MAKRFLLRDMIFKKKEATVIENMLVTMVSLIMVCAFLVIIFGAFAGISDKWSMRQAAREYLLIMETEGYLKPEDAVSLVAELNSYGLTSVSLSGTTMSEVDYGERIYLKITGTYDENVLAFAGGISKVTAHPTTIVISRQTTAKQEEGIYEKEGSNRGSLLCDAIYHGAFDGDYHLLPTVCGKAYVHSARCG